MIIEEAIRYYLANNSFLSALHGGRVYVMRMPQTVTMPVLTYQRISTVIPKTHDMVGFSGLYRGTFQIDAWGSSFASAKGLINKVIEQLNGFKGVMGTGAGVVIDAVLLESLRDDFHPETGIYRQSADFVIWYKEG